MTKKGHQKFLPQKWKFLPQKYVIQKSWVRQKNFRSPKLGAMSPPLPNTNPKSLTALNLTLNGSKDANIISHSKFLLKVVGWLGMWRTTVSLGPRLHILAIHSKFHYRNSFS